MVKKLNRRVKTGASALLKRPRQKKGIDAEERILQAATIHLIRKVGGLFVATALREDHCNGAQRWIITVTMRYPTGHEGYVGDLLYNGTLFTMLTEDSVIDERVRQIAADPEGVRLWNGYRASTLRAGKK